MAIFNLKCNKSFQLKYLKVGKCLRWKEESDYSDLNRQKFSASEVICWNRQLQHCHSNDDNGDDDGDDDTGDGDNHDDDNADADDEDDDGDDDGGDNEVFGVPVRRRAIPTTEDAELARPSGYDQAEKRVKTM